MGLEVEEKEGNNQGLITQALLVGDLDSAVDLCLKDGMYPHALTLAAHAGPRLFDKVCISLQCRCGVICKCSFLL